MKQFFIITILALFIGILNSNAQTITYPVFSSLDATNSHFKAGEFNISIAPTVSSRDFLNQAAAHTFGYSLETEYWQSKSIGTGLELGSYDIKNTPGGIDHLAVMEDIRLIAFENVKFLDRFDLELKTGAETFLRDGSKDLEIGVGIEFDYTIFKHHLRTELSGLEHFRTNPSLDGFTIKLSTKIFTF